MAKRKRNSQPTRSVLQLEPKTENQKEYIKTIAECHITFCTGVAGTGKSFICAGVVSNYLLNNDFKRAIITRPLICTGKDIGALPGEVQDKIDPYLAPMKKNIKHFCGPMYGEFFNANRIVYEPLETMRGNTYDESIMILDEAQNCTEEQIVMFVTRMGRDSKVIINGDIGQTDLKGKSGLINIMYKIEQSKCPDFGVVKLGKEDIQRNGILSTFLEIVEND